MSLRFSANQYDKAFEPLLLQNWEVPKLHRLRPRAFEGFTQIVANDRGHLLQGVKRSRESPWGTFVGTWDMPLKIPSNHMTNDTARTVEAMERLERCKTDGEIILKGKLKRCRVPSALPVKADLQVDIEPNKVHAPVAKGPLPYGKTIHGANQRVGSGNRLQPLASPKVGSARSRSGAQNPEPFTTCSPKPMVDSNTPLQWPEPMTSRVKSATPMISPKPGTPLNVMSPKFGSPKPPSPLIEQQALAPIPLDMAPQTVMSPTQNGLNWPSPKTAEPQYA